MNSTQAKKTLDNNYSYYCHASSSLNFVGNPDAELKAFEALAKDGDSYYVNELWKKVKAGKYSLDAYHVVRRAYNVSTGMPENFGI